MTTTAGLAARHGLDGAVVVALDAILAALARDAHAPTTVRAPAEAVDVHLADSLSALDLEPVRAARTIADLGAGAGFPALALAAARPEAAVAAVESVARKCEAIRRTAAAAGLANVSVVCARAEGWPAGRTAHDLVTARALAPLPVVLEYAAPLLTVGGAVVVWRGRRDPDEELAAARAATELGLELEEVTRTAPFPSARHRHLHTFRKAAQTPDRFPRRPGQARKRPLGTARLG